MRILYTFIILIIIGCASRQLITKDVIIWSHKFRTTNKKCYHTKHFFRITELKYKIGDTISIE